MTKAKGPPSSSLVPAQSSEFVLYQTEDGATHIECRFEKPEPDHRQGSYQALNAAKWPVEARDVELHGVVSVRGFKNRNAHVTFLRPDLVDRMNQILAKHYPMALPPASE